ATQLDQPFGSFPGLIAAWGDYRGDAPALYDGTVTLSWREVADRVLRRVSSATNGTQTPQYGDKGTEGQFLFVNVDPSAAPVLAPGVGKVAKRNLRASLRLTGLPTGAVVKVDGKALAGDRYEVDLIDVDRKEVTVFVTAEGYESEVSEAVLERGKD
ncbi:MAG: hypothetical protein ACOVT5_10085, partial [Armatimonadaceae bacterium]